MHFKLTNKNPYRDLVKYSNVIARSAISDKERVSQYVQLYDILKNRLVENEVYLHNSPAFAERCSHWNYRDIKSIKPISTEKNPWLNFKRQFEKAVKATSNSSYSEVANLVSKELAWFYSSTNRNDWVVSKGE